MRTPSTPAYNTSPGIGPGQVITTTIIRQTVLIVLLITSPPAIAQNTLWTRTYGGTWQDGAHDVAKTSDGGLVVTGFNSSSSTNHLKDILLMKTDALGNELWSRTFGGFLNDIGTSVRQTQDGGYIITGMTEVAPQIYDPFLIRTDSNGSLLWQQQYDLGDDDRGHSVWQTSDGGFILAGQAWLGSATFGSYDMYVVKTDPAGNVQWQRTYAYDNSAAPGADVALSIQQLSDGGYIIGGFTQSSVWASYLIRTDSLGNPAWSRTYGNGAVNECYSILPTLDGGFIMTGALVSYTTDTDVLLIKMDANGNPLWQRTHGGENSDQGESIRQLPDGGFVVAGMTGSFGAGSWDVYVVRTNAVGDTLWTRSFGGESDDRGWSVEVSEGGSIVVAGWAWSFGGGLGDVYLLKLMDSPLEVETDPSLPVSTTLLQNYPNPFNPSTTIRFEISKSSLISLKVYDVLGREVAALVNKEMNAGKYEVRWNAFFHSSGLYFYQLRTDDGIETRRMLLLK